MVHTGRKQCGNARRLAKRAHAPDARSVPWSGTPEPYAPRGTAHTAKMTAHEREMIDAWDNTGTTGNTVEYDRAHDYTRLRIMARRSGTHVYDGPVRHDVRAIEGKTVDPIASTAARDFVRMLNIENKASRG